MLGRPLKNNTKTLLLEIENLSLKIEDKTLLSEISIRLSQNEILALVGESGSGKSLLALSVLGLQPKKGKLTANRLLFNNESLLSIDKKIWQKLRGNKIGMVFQGGALFDSLSIAENIMFPLKMFTKQSKSEMEERVNSALKRVKLENAHKKMPSEASGGMKKRVAIARAIVNNPKYLFCDEPNSGLDPKTAIVIDNLIQEITKEYDIVTVINSHDMNSVMEIGEKIIFLKDGLKAWEGSKNTIFKTDNEVVTDFVYSSNLFKKVQKMYLDEL